MNTTYRAETSPAEPVDELAWRRGRGARERLLATAHRLSYAGGIQATGVD